jgi:hypothetical protein
MSRSEAQVIRRRRDRLKKGRRMSVSIAPPQAGRGTERPRRGVQYRVSWGNPIPATRKSCAGSSASLRAPQYLCLASESRVARRRPIKRSGGRAARPNHAGFEPVVGQRRPMGGDLICVRRWVQGTCNFVICCRRSFSRCHCGWFLVDEAFDSRPIHLAKMEVQPRELLDRRSDQRI